MSETFTPEQEKRIREIVQEEQSRSSAAVNLEAIRKGLEQGRSSR